MPQVECRKHSFLDTWKAGHHGFLEDVSFQIIDRVFGVSRHKEGFWQFRLQSFMPVGLNARFVDHYLFPLHFPSLIASFVSLASIQQPFFFLHTSRTLCIIMRSLLSSFVYAFIASALPFNRFGNMLLIVNKSAPLRLCPLSPHCCVGNLSRPNVIVSLVMTKISNRNV